MGSSPGKLAFEDPGAASARNSVGGLVQAGQVSTSVDAKRALRRRAISIQDISLISACTNWPKWLKIPCYDLAIDSELRPRMGQFWLIFKDYPFTGVKLDTFKL